MCEQQLNPSYFRVVLVATLLIALAGCAAVNEGLSKAVIMDYDQVNNFRRYEFETSILWPAGTSETPQSGIYGGGKDVPNNGFWVAFVICDIRNENSQAETFNYDVHNFFVVYGGQEHHYKELAPFTYTSIPLGLNATPAANNKVNKQFRDETQLGNDTNTFNKGYDADVNYRFAIYVTFPPSGPVDISVPLQLRYKGHPNLLNSRDQPPIVKDPATRAELRTTCRPKAQ